MTTYTSTDWVTHILRKSAILGEDESPTAAQLSEGLQIVSSRIAYLEAINVPIWNGSLDSVPEAWFDPGADYMALYVRQGFGGPAPTEPEIIAAMKPLRQLSARPATGTVAKVEYF